ncbi:MAG TPA: N-acetylmuramoyl-L-alanine amidase [Streptosporangiaceae bacterium]|jgi:Mannosyl-glycoprotein endo-beta-N-acetylglucosaminidase/N-acetylmuramoyl-L-alanine amidase|nr:N-acetylmuramoyl-L-alanine amidase [Streptosporangiaceae bacterium]
MPQDRLDVFLAVGHGVEDNGVFDPGAIGTDGRMEHMEAFQVCTFALAAMRRSGLTVISETAQGASHDPDFMGSARRANELNPRVAIEVHFDSHNGVPGYSGLFVSDQGKQLAARIGAAFEARNLPRASDVERPNLHFLNATSMPALIPEINRVHDFPVEVNRAQGEALAEGVCAFLGQPFKPPAGGPDKIDHPNPHPHPHPHPHDNGPVTENSKLLAGPRAPAHQAREFLLGKSHGDYTNHDVEVIVDGYYATAIAVGLDPLLVVAQMSEETGHLTSFWSQRPRRNFAGIGVTGEEGKGNKFPSLTAGIRAHTGRLLAYVLPAGAANPAQAALITEALEARDLPADRRGIAPTLAGLSGKWATDKHYAAKVVSVANQIRNGS